MTFVIDEKIKDGLIAEDSKSAELIKPFLIGRDKKRYEPPSGNKYLIFTRRGIDIKQYPAIHKYLLPFKERLMPKPKDWKGENKDAFDKKYREDQSFLTGLKKKYPSKLKF